MAITSVGGDEDDASRLAMRWESAGVECPKMDDEGPEGLVAWCTDMVLYDAHGRSGREGDEGSITSR